MTVSPTPAEAIAALLEEGGLPDAVRSVLTQAKTYEERCLAINEVGDRLFPEFVNAFKATHGTLLANARTTVILYLTARGLIPPASG